MIRETTRSTQEIAEELRPALLRLARNLRRETEALGVTSHQVTLLWLVRSRPGLSLRELAVEEGISAPRSPATSTASRPPASFGASARPTTAAVSGWS